MTGRRPDALDTFAEATAPREDAVERVLEGVVPQIDPQPVVQILPRTPRRRPLRPWLLPVALAAAVLLVAAGFFATRGPSYPVVLTAEHTKSALLARGVHATFEGHGQLQQGSPVLVHWSQGQILLSVLADAERPVTVRTEEAMVQVVGTLFTVNRDALGTHVQVSHGTVNVTCSGQEPVALSAGASKTCEPVGASILGRLKQLSDEGMPAEQLLEAIEQAQLAAPGHLKLELQARRIEVLLEADRREEARAAVELLLDVNWRRSQMLRLRASLAESCEARLRDLARIPTGERLPEDDAMEAACR